MMIYRQYPRIETYEAALRAERRREVSGVVFLAALIGLVVYLSVQLVKVRHQLRTAQAAHAP